MVDSVLAGVLAPARVQVPRTLRLKTLTESRQGQQGTEPINAHSGQKHPDNLGEIFKALVLLGKYLKDKY